MSAARSSLRPSKAGAALIALALALPGPALAASNYAEGFDDNGPVQSDEAGPLNLINKGWIFRHQSNPPGPWAWLDEDLGDPQDGSGALGASVWSVDRSGTISDWAILPAVPGQQAGDVMSFYWSASQSRADRIQVRYSPTGATDTGTGPEDIGDFTELLLDTLPVTNSGWIPLSVEVPGTGRLAIRRYLNPGGLDTSYGTLMRIDSLTVATPVAPPPPGEVTWFAADNPHVISGTVVIPADQIVTAEPGVVIEVEPNSVLRVEGRLVAQGTPADHISITGQDYFIFEPALLIAGGTADLAYADLGCIVVAQGDSSLLLADCTVSAGSINTALDFVSNPYVQVDRCAFLSGTNLAVTDGTLALRDSTFTSTQGSSSLSLLRGYLYLDNVLMDGANLSIARERSPQPIYLDNFEITNNPDRPGVRLTGVNAFFGPGAVIQNNLWTGDLWGAGVLPGSTLPPTGNTNNGLLNSGDGDRRGSAVWADAGVPYVVTGGYVQFGGFLHITDGADVLLGSGAYIMAEPADLQARGTPDNPITFGRLDPGAQWQGLHFFNRFENTIIDGGHFGARFHDTNGPGGFIDNCVIRNCDFGSRHKAVIRKTRFIDNVTGAYRPSFPDDAVVGLEGANSFEGNTVALDGVDRSIDATFNWWGDPSGPSAADNPAGSGDVVLGAVATVPFLTQPPNFADNPPIVHLNAVPYTASVGDRFFVTWTTSDDGSIASHRVLFRGRFGEEFQVLADDIPAGQHGAEITIPDIAHTSLHGLASIRVESTDDAGQVGWDERTIDVPWTTSDTTTLTYLSDFTGPFGAGGNIDVCWAGPMVRGYLILDADDASVPIGGSNTGCLAIGLDLPFVSTDSARIVLTYDISTNERKHFFSEPFAIRPDTRLGDAPPVVQMTTPLAGETYASGAVLPIRWTASDDEALRSFTVQASYDAGVTWHTIGADLPASAGAYDWAIPPSQGYDDLRVRVVARDLRFQNSSDGADRPLAITPPAPCAADIDASGTTDVLDFAILAANFGATELRAFTNGDLDGDSDADVFDFTVLAADFGCGN